MKKIIAAIIVCVSLSAGAHAQTSMDQKHGGMQMKQMLKDSLHLTDVQIDSVTAIRGEFMGKMKQIRDDNSISADDKKTQIKPLREEMKMRLKAILTKDQMRKLQEMQQGKRGGKMDADN